MLAFLTVPAYFMANREGDRDLAIGAELRNARVQRGLTIEQVAQDTRISARFLRALEEDDFEALPAPVYVRGFLRSYANYLRIDSQPLLDELNAELESPSYPPDEFIGGPPSGRQSSAQQLPRAASPPSDPFRRSPANRGQPPVIDDLTPVKPAQPPEIWDEAPLSAAAAPAGPASGAATPPNRPRPRGVSSDPFVRATFPPPPPSEEAAAASWDDDYAQPIYVDDPDDPAYDEEPAGRQRGREGAAVYRPDAEPDDSQRTRLVVLFAVIGLAGIIFVALAILLVNRDNGDSANTAAPLPTTTPAGRTVIPLGSRTPTAVASGSAVASPVGSPVASPSVSPVASTSPTPDGTATPAPPTNTPGPTNTPRPPTATPTFDPSTPTATPDLNTPTVTPVPPTSTPIIPTSTPRPPTPTPLPSHPFGRTECDANGNCSLDGTGNIRVICAPDGWFIDGPLNGRFNNTAGWREANVTRIADASTICG